MDRRRFLAATTAMGAAALARPALAQSARRRTLNFVPAAALTALDPIWTTAAVTRVHGYMVFDSLYGMDATLQPSPQMAEGARFDDDGRTCTITLRAGLTFHDGQKVRAADCVASLKRWMKRHPLGQKLELATDELAAVDDLRLRFRLKQRFPLLLHALAAVGPQALIMPERLAQTDAFQQVREVVGSGPYRFKADEYVSGSRAVYERNADYVPTPAVGNGLTSGPKLVHMDRVVWNMIPDLATSAAALQSGEVDWVEQPTPEIAALLRRDRNLKVEPIDLFPQVGVLRFNHLNPPFNDPAIRRALLPAINQADFAIAVVGDEKGMWLDNVGVFTPGTASASAVGLEPLQGPRSFDQAKSMLREAGYTNQQARLLVGTDLASVRAIGEVAADTLQRCGLNLDLVMADWGTVVQRRASQEPLDKGGWSIFCTHASWFEFSDPAVSGQLRGNGRGATVGWPTIPRLEELRDSWFDAPDDAARRRITEDIQRTAMHELPFIPLGAFHFVTAHRANLVDRITALPLFWNLRWG